MLRHWLQFKLQVTKRKEEKDEKSNRDNPSTSALYVSAAYLFNPYIILNCIGLTTTVFTNLLYSIALVSMTRRSMFWSCISIALLTLQGLYPISLMVPATIYVASTAKNKKISIVTMLIIFTSILVALFAISYCIMESWSFLWSTIGFILTVPDLRPNIGLYWYFFTEMFEHFRWLFIASFQINVSLLYIVPLALRLRREPMLLAFSYLAIAAIFKSYPCIGDVGFYISLLPLWKHLFQRELNSYFHDIIRNDMNYSLTHVSLFFSRHATRIHCRLFCIVLHSLRPNRMASVDLLQIGKRQLLLWGNLGVCDSANLPFNGHSICQCETRVRSSAWYQ